MYRILTEEKVKKNIEKFLEIDKDFSIIEGTYFVIENKKKFIGYGVLEKDNYNFILKKIFINENYRFKSYGTKLLNFMITSTIKKGNLIAYKDKNLNRFLEKFGFKLMDNFYILENLERSSEREKEGKKTVYYSIFWNIILAISKIFGGWYGRSRALLSDGFNSLSDVATSIGILLGIHFSNIPEDEEHPFGHEKIESIIGIVLGIIMILTSFELIQGSVEIIIAKDYNHTPNITTIFWAGFSSIVKFFMYRQKLRVGLKTNNTALIADAKDSRNDVFSSLGVILGILLSIFVAPIFDTLMSILVALLIFKEGVAVILETTDTILDKQDPELIKEIEKYISENSEVTNIHDIMMRQSGDNIFLSLHIRVPKNMTVYEAHTISEEIEESIITDFPEIKSVIIHVDYLIN
ncbi:cation diffusion facilitator family transporter [Cetobacterium ceti]|uniref:Cation diffusion facilitator family transporter n=1 Tax=Cetobacterium ceti TaxID=180163 RepID=A0A1T4MZP4_9FUSO|nr:GNAT family N-acetyltransferase [Cetobacterium ceti]SJZ72529.1 cation diffusion facilitator family transporter [Cetobacterium ceti]